MKNKSKHFILYVIPVIIAALLVIWFIKSKGSERTNTAAKTNPPQKQRTKRVLEINELVETTKPQWETLQTLGRVNQSLLYFMEYRGGYDFDEFLEKGLETGWYLTSTFAETQHTVGCDAIPVRTGNGDMLLAVNINAAAVPFLLLSAHPPQGNSSISIVPLEWLGYPPGSADLLIAAEHNVGLLETPYWPVSGMNTHGLALTAMIKDRGKRVVEPGKITIDGTHVIRLILDHAKNLDQATALIKKYNNNASGYIYYLIADASGHWAVVEYTGGKIVIGQNRQSWPGAENIGSQEQAMKHLEHISLEKPAKRGINIKTRVSVVYNLTTREIHIVTGMKYQNVKKFKI
jgi:hypothetical protein